MQVPRYPVLLPETQPESAQTFSPRMWRRLLTQPLLAPGSSILVAGRNPLDAIDLLVDLAYDVTGWCEDPDAVFRGRRGHPLADFEHWQPRSIDPGQKPRFDLVLALQVTSHAGDLYGSAVREQTAGLLASLKPGGRLLLFTPDAPQTVHPLDCWLRHLDCFPGRRAAHWLTDTWWPTGLPEVAPRPLLNQNSRQRPEGVSPRRLFTESRRPRRVLTVSLQIPQQPLSPGDWLEFARSGLLTGQRSCCAAASAVPQPLRHAA